MDAAEALDRFGGVATRRDLLAVCSRRRLEAAVAAGVVVRSSRDRYVLPTAAVAKRAAARLHGIVSHLGAAAHWGWEIKAQPELPIVSIRRNRKLDPARAVGVSLRWTTWSEGEVVDLVTSPVRTVLDCARDLAFDEALSVADSALRRGSLTKRDLVEAAAVLRGPGSSRARRVAAWADGRAANPFESTLRAIAVEEGLDAVAQLAVAAGDFVVHPDVADPSRGLALEAESWTHHGKDRADFERDCARYNALVVAGWTVLRFTWEQVMWSPRYVRWVIRGCLDDPGPSRRAQRPGEPPIAA